MKLKGGDNYAIGLDKYQSKSYSEAILYFTFAIENDKNYDAFYYRGMAKSKLNDFEGAVSDYDMAIYGYCFDINIARNYELDQYYALIYYNRAEAKKKIKDFEGAIEDYTETIRLDQKAKRKCLIGIILVNFRLANIDRTISAIKEIIEIDPGKTKFNNLLKSIKKFDNGLNLGDIAYKNKRYERAIFAYSWFLFKYQNSSEGYSKRGNSKFKLKLYEDAIDDYSIAINLNPSSETNYISRANAKYNLKLYKDAIDDYSKAIELNPNEENNFKARGDAKYNLNLYIDSIDDYARAIELNPTSENNIVSRAKANYNLKLYKNAIEDYSRAIELNPNKSNYYRLRAEAKLNLKKYFEAKEDFNKAIEINNKCWVSYGKLGLVKFILNNYEEAISDLETSIELNSDYQYAITKLKFIKKYFKDCTESSENFIKYDLVIKLNPTNPEAYFERGLSKIHLNKLFTYKNAIDDFKIGFELKYKVTDDKHYQLKRQIEIFTEYIIIYLERKEEYNTLFTFYELCSKHRVLYYSVESIHDGFSKYVLNYLKAKIQNNIANYNFETFEKITQLSKLLKSYYYKRHYNLEYEEFNKSKPFIDYTKEELNISLLKVYKLDYNMGFGKYTGQSVSSLIKIDPEYFIFCIINLKHFAVTNDALVNKDLEKQLNYFEAIEINFHKINLITKKMKEEERLDEDRFHLNDEYFPDYDNM